MYSHTEAGGAIPNAGSPQTRRHALGAIRRETAISPGPTCLMAFFEHIYHHVCHPFSAGRSFSVLSAHALKSSLTINTVRGLRSADDAKQRTRTPASPLLSPWSTSFSQQNFREQRQHSTLDVQRTSLSRAGWQRYDFNKLSWNHLHSPEVQLEQESGACSSQLRALRDFPKATISPLGPGNERLRAHRTEVKRRLCRPFMQPYGSSASSICSRKRPA